MGERLVYLDVLRVLATLAVVVVHVVSRSWYSVDVHTAQWAWLNLFDGMVRWCVPVFVMISGALFLNPDKSVSLKSLYRKSVLRLVAAFAIASTLYALWDVALGRVGSPGEFVLRLFSGRNHLWFLYMLAGLYVITPLCRKLAADKALLRYFLGLSLVFTFIIPTFLAYMSANPTFTEVSIVGVLVNSLRAAYEKTNFTFTLGYVAYYMLGYYLSVIGVSLKARIATYGLGVLSLLFTVMFTLGISLLNHAPYEGAYGYMTLNVALMSVALFVFVKHLMSRDAVHDCWAGTLKEVSKVTFLLYLLHQFVLDCLIDFLLGVQTVSACPVLFVPLCSMAGFFISLCLALVASRVIRQTVHIAKGD